MIEAGENPVILSRCCLHHWHSTVHAGDLLHRMKSISEITADPRALSANWSITHRITRRSARPRTAFTARPEMSHTTFTVPDMNEPPRRRDIIIRVAKEAGRHTDPAAFATVASQAAASRDASILSAHTAEEIICVVSVAAATGPQAVAMALAVVADALSAGDPQRSPIR